MSDIVIASLQDVIEGQMMRLNHLENMIKQYSLEVSRCEMEKTLIHSNLIHLTKAINKFNEDEQCQNT